MPLSADFSKAGFAANKNRPWACDTTGFLECHSRCAPGFYNKAAHRHLHAAAAAFYELRSFEFWWKYWQRAETEDAYPRTNLPNISRWQADCGVPSFFASSTFNFYTVRLQACYYHDRI